MKPSIKWLLGLLFTGVLTLVLVNETAPGPTSAFDPDRCTRYCHDQGCLHAGSASTLLNSTPVKNAYEAHIAFLKHNPLGISYQAANLLLFLVLYPAAFLMLWFRLFRKHQA